MDCVENEEQSLSIYVDQAEERLLKFVRSEETLSQYDEQVSKTKKRKKEERKRQWKEKQLHEKFLRETEEVQGEGTWGWIKKGYLKKETEGLKFAAQEQALRINWIKKNIDGQDISEKCRMSGEMDKSIAYVIAECKNLHRNSVNRDMIALPELCI